MIKHLYDTFAKCWLKPTGNSVWIFSDPHFGDFDAYRFKHLIKVPDKRDYFSKFKDGDIFETYETFIAKEIAKADTEQIKKINSKVGKNDTIIFLGDIGNIECVKKIKGYKVLIMGNHDKGASNYKRITDYIEYWYDDEGSEEFKNIALNKIKEFTNCGYVDKVYSEGRKIIHKLTLENRLFDEVYEGPLMINDRVILSHEPIAVPEYMYNIHGHVHNKDYKGDEHHLNVCAESIDFTPVNLLKLIKEGLLKNIPDIHRPTIDSATERKKKRGGKDGGKKG